VKKPDEQLHQELAVTIAQFDAAIATDRASEIAAFFRDDGRLMWPSLEDIAGRAAIRAAFDDFVATFTTLSWQPDRQLVDIYEDKAFTLGRFVETRRPRAGGPGERVHGRLVEVWRREESGTWKLAALLTSRYAPTERLEDVASD
jgi:ketosteroid isomerase-like protein